MGLRLPPVGLTEGVVVGVTEAEDEWVADASVVERDSVMRADAVPVHVGEAASESVGVNEEEAVAGRLCVGDGEDVAVSGAVGDALLVWVVGLVSDADTLLLWVGGVVSDADGNALIDELALVDGVPLVDSDMLLVMLRVAHVVPVHPSIQSHLQAG